MIVHIHRYSICQTIPSPDDCILDVVLMVSPKRQYRGILFPTTPATIFPAKRGNKTTNKNSYARLNNTEM